MTRLRDDGHLETDSPVVASCFIGELVCVKDLHHKMVDRLIYSVSKGGIWNGRHDDFPILISARVVAEVKATAFKWYVIIGAVEGGAPALHDWLRQHVKEDADG